MTIPVLTLTNTVLTMTNNLPKVKMAYYEDAMRKKDDAHSKWKTADAKVRLRGGGVIIRT